MFCVHIPAFLSTCGRAGLRHGVCVPGTCWVQPGVRQPRSLRVTLIWSAGAAGARMALPMGSVGQEL